MIGQPLWTSQKSHNKSLFGRFAYPDDLNATLRKMHQVLGDDVRLRLSKSSRRRSYLCDLVCGSLSAESTTQTCSVNKGRVHVAFIVDSVTWAGGALMAIASLLETNGGSCHLHGAFHFHIILPMPSDAERFLRAELNESTARPSLPLTLHSLTAEFPEDAEDRHLLDHAKAVDHHRVHDHEGDEQLHRARQQTQLNDSQRLNRAANFARFALADLLPRHVEFVLYLDADVVAVQGRFSNGERRAPLKRVYHVAVEAMRAAQAEAERTGERRSLRAAMAAVPSPCTPEEFAGEMVDRQFMADRLMPNWRSTEEAATFEWMRAWAVGRPEETRASSLCFNAGVFIAHLANPLWISLRGELDRLARSRRPAGCPLPHPLWSAGSQRPMRVVFAGNYTPLPSLVNVAGCGASRLMHKSDVRTDRDVASAEQHRLIEFGNLGALLHFTGGHKPMNAFTYQVEQRVLSRSGVRPCAFLLKLVPFYALLAERLLRGDARVLPGSRDLWLGNLVAEASSSRERHGERGAMTKACAPLEFLCRPEVGLKTVHNGAAVCLAKKCGVTDVAGCARRGRGQCCAPFIVHTGRVCCAATNSGCVLPCEPTSRSVCTRGIRAKMKRYANGTRRPLHVAVCIPQTCGPTWLITRDAGHGARCARLNGTRSQCCGSQIIEQGGSHCCNEADTACVIPQCVPKAQQCQGGILAQNGTLCIPNGCRTATEFGCDRRPGGKHICCPSMVSRHARPCCYARDSSCRIMG